MGNNHSKPCSGDPERELRRVQQEALQKLYTPSSDTAQKMVHIHCRPEEVDQILQEVHAAPIMLHCKVETSLEITPKNPLEGGEKPGAAENSEAAVSVDTKTAQPGRDVPAKLEMPPGDAVVRSKLVADLVVGSHAQPPEMDGTLAYLCDQVFSSALHRIEKSSRDISGRPKGHSAVQGPSLSSLESQPSKLSYGSQASCGSIGAVEPLNSADGQPPKEGSFLANDQKAPCLELAPGDISGAVEEPTTTGHVQLEQASFEKSLEKVGEALPDVSATEMADRGSDINVAPRTQVVAEPLLNLDEDLPEAVAESILVLNGGEDGVPEDDCDGEKVDAQPEENELPASVVQNVEAQPPSGFAEITRDAASSPKTPLKTTEMGQDGPPFPSAGPTAPVNGREVDQGTQLAPLSFSVPKPALEDSSPGQNL
ncbi:uncharacterized protein LOC143828853 [Paroedura picta]|uniref:uncharacterized protein LOC143828853 n=1 Tax=Paroedura picta TaxID=143630 RepID=UPI00405602F3